MSVSPWWLSALLVGSATIAAALTYALSRPSSLLSILDVPNERSLHVRPTPRTGGLAIVTVVTLGWLAIALGWGFTARFGWIASGAIVVALVSFADDRSGVHPRYRLLSHLASAALLVAGDLTIERVTLPGASIELGPIAGCAATVAFVMWMTNLYNFMDGMDGFAGGMSVAGFGFMGYELLAHGDEPTALAAFVVVGGTLGFLRYNFPPASIFLGDVGAAPLGFLAAAFMLHGEDQGSIPLWGAVLVFSPFVVDATVTLVRRLLRREKIWLAHRTHYYQRLVQLGWGHRRTVLAEYALMAACGASALAAPYASTGAQQAALAAWLLLYVALMVAVSRLERARARR